MSDSSEHIENFLNHKTWAVIGASNNSAKYGYKVYQRLKKIGYSVYAINPGLDAIEGDSCYPSLAALPTIPDCVSMIVPPKITEQVVSDCLDLGINKVWLQPGSQSDEAIHKCEEHGVTVIHNECILVQTRDKLK